MKEERIIKAELSYIKKKIMSGKEWDSVKESSFRKNFFNLKMEKTIVKHEVGHALFAYNNNNFRSLYLGKKDNKIRFGVVFSKHQFKSQKDIFSFLLSGLLSSFTGSEDIKNIIISLHDLYKCSWSGSNFTKFDKDVNKLIRFLNKNEEKILQLQKLIYKDCKKNKNDLLRISEEDLKKYLSII